MFGVARQVKSKAVSQFGGRDGKQLTDSLCSLLKSVRNKANTGVYEFPHFLTPHLPTLIDIEFYTFSGHLWPF